MLNNKENEKIIDDYDYLSNAASARDCTGLIPALPTSEAELEAYNDVYQYQPPVIKEKTDKHANTGKGLPQDHIS
ncbi:hypothetical protein DWX43_17780 [Clostridium sp. AF19-22AC]|jgi:hypothetical protein|uniref:Uncharacterized protein n=1 Tax=Faecalicatena orotica TaxID=1544 RepID=A0A2Y9B8I7_9FIRM|nr:MULTISPECIES: hypothetical protein [Clostridia]PWJ32332.1 hypothetical protein A8806_101620 [Faecalicatena orotica]RHR25672.1 hypothetical protein DWX43_17780 [Clostridium sp. AF19-22AC]SSA54166.1 hypothetical protein SAMN05216536_101620 [Faecalicatena orotica]